MSALARAWAPGRVNLMGDHTDYTGGLALPMATDLGTEVRLARGGKVLELTSASQPGVATIAVDAPLPAGRLASVTPAWARYVAGVVAEIRPAEGGNGTIESSLPIGAGLSSSAALEVATALALGFDGSPLALAQVCQAAESAAASVPCGLMDQLASACGVPGHALLMDLSTLETTPIPVPSGVEVLVVHSGEERSLPGSGYARRRAECEEAARAVGPLSQALVSDLDVIADPIVRRRARHVVTENARVLATAEALREGRVDLLGEIFAASHASLAGEFDVSTPALDQVVARLSSMPAVLGARLTGAGFGGCVVALVRRGELDPRTMAWRSWTVQASGPAFVETLRP